MTFTQIHAVYYYLKFLIVIMVNNTFVFVELFLGILKHYYLIRNLVGFVKFCSKLGAVSDKLTFNVNLIMMSGSMKYLMQESD